LFDALVYCFNLHIGIKFTSSNSRTSERIGIELQIKVPGKGKHRVLKLGVLKTVRCHIPKPKYPVKEWYYVLKFGTSERVSITCSNSEFQKFLVSHALKKRSSKG